MTLSFYLSKLNGSARNILLFSGWFILTVSFFAAATNAENFMQPLNGALDTSFSGGVTEGKVNVSVSAVQTDGKILVGGGFSFANGTEKNTLARLNADGTLDTTFNSGSLGPNGGISDIKILSDGKILIVGAFGTYNGVVKNGFARLNSDGTLDAAFNSGGTGVSGTAQTIAVQPDGRILISGNITAYNGTAKFAIVRLNADGSLDTSFAAPFTTNQFVEGIEIQTDGKVVISGGFTIGTPARAGVARLNSDGSLDTTFNPSGGGTNAGVFALKLQADGKILIGGGFTTYSAVPRSGIARLAADGSLDTTFTPPSSFSPSNAEYFAVTSTGKIYVAGTFRNSNITFGLLRLNADGTLDSTIPIASVDNSGYHVTLQADGKPLFSGFFNRLASQPRNNLVRFNTDGSVDTTFNPSFVGFGYASAIAQQTDGKIVAAGNFNFANANARNNVARFNADGTLDNSFNTGAGTFAELANSSNIINAVAVQPDGKILIGGNFSGYAGTQRRSIARLNADGSLDTTFSAEAYFALLGSTFLNDIIVLPDGRILIAGIFVSNTNPPIAQGVIRLNSDGTQDTSFTAVPVNAAVVKMVRQPDGKILLGGGFTVFTGQTSRNRIMRINQDGGVDTTFTFFNGANSVVQNLALQSDGKIIIGGNFTSYEGVSVNRIARLNGDGTLDSSFNVGTGTNGSVEGIAIQSDGKVVIGGRFTTYNGTTTNRLARLNVNGNIDSSFISGFDGDVRFFVRRVLLQTDGKLMVSGLFKSYANTTRNALVRIQTATAANRTRFDFDGDGKADISVFRPSNGAWYILQSQNGFTGVSFGANGDKIVPADYDGDGKTDVAVYRSGTWYLQRSAQGFTGVSFGAADDIPQPGDYDGDGKAELAVFRPSNGGWYVYNLTTNQTSSFQFGISTDKPVAADYDGDGKFDYAVFRSGTWYIQRSAQGFTGIGFGDVNDKCVQADYDGDGKTDVAVYRPSTGAWYLLQSTAGFTGVGFGISTDLPVPADFDGDGKADVAVFRNGTWYIQQSTNGFTGIGFGASDDKPIPNAFVP